MTNVDKVKYQTKYPEKFQARIKSTYLPKRQGFVNHHWSYNEEHFIDIIQLSQRDHKKLHRFMYYDPDRKMYRTIYKDLLDTKEKHIEYAKFVVENLYDNPGKLPKIDYTIGI